MISAELEGQILRYHLVEKWSVGLIARKLKIHHTTVRRALHDKGVAAPPSGRHSIADTYLPFIHEVLAEHPELPASRLYAMIVERGYPGRPDHFRRLIATIRPRKAPEAFLRRRTLVGEEAQADWGHFGLHWVGRAQRALSAFVLVLSWSRRPFVRFFYDQRMGSFLSAHIAAFEAFGGVPRTILYDNLKSVVVQRRGDLISLNDQIIAFAKHYRYKPQPVAVRRGNEKGRVERTIAYLRTSFWPARKWTDIDDLNGQAERWCKDVAGTRECPEDATMNVWEAAEMEKGRLMPLPPDAYPAEDIVEVHIGKQPYARFDRNDYSVPASMVRRTLNLRATSTEVRIFYGLEQVASHLRSFSTGEQVENPAHLAELVEQKRNAKEARAVDRLHQASPAAQGLIARAVSRHRRPNVVVAQLLDLLDTWGLERFNEAIAEGDVCGAASSADLLQILERLADQRSQPLPLATPLSTQAKEKSQPVRTHPLASYDQEVRGD